MFWTFIHKTTISPLYLVCEVASWSYTYLYRALNCSLFARVLFHIFKHFFETGPADHLIIEHTLQCKQNSSWYHTQKVCYMAEFSRIDCLGGESSHLLHAPDLKGWSCSSICPDKMSSGGRLKGYSWICSFFTWFISRDVASLNWFGRWLLAFASPCWTVQLGIFHRPTTVAQAWQQWCSCAHCWSSPLCFLLP